MKSGNVAFKDKEMNVALEKYQKAHRYSSAAANVCISLLYFLWERNQHLSVSIDRHSYVQLILIAPEENEKWGLL